MEEVRTVSKEELSAGVDLLSGGVETDARCDLGNLALFDYAPFDLGISEETLQSRARENAQALLNKIFMCPSELAPDNIGRLALLPEPSTPLPREKPVPKPKALTTWEKFARTKGIQNRKRGRMVYDEMKEEWAPRYGYKRANDESQEWAIEAKPGEDPSVDPWTAQRQEKKARVAQNSKKQLNNLRAAAPGDRLPGTMDLTKAVRPASKKRSQKEDKKEKHHVEVTLAVAQSSTASMGRFDKLRNNEKPQKQSSLKGKKSAQSNEKKQSLSVLKQVLGDDSVSDKFNVEKAINNRQVALESEQVRARDGARKPQGRAKNSGKGSKKKGSKSSKGK